MKSKMLRYLSATLLALLCGLNVQAQDAIYVYRNDGSFNAFFNDEIISMQCSQLDLDGREHQDYVVQEVLTADSLYRIPLEAIDSISFVKPENKMKNDVRHLDALLTYINKVDGRTITFLPSMPAELRPAVGDVLIYDRFDCDLLPTGFAGRVESMDGTVCSCSEVTLEDVYESFVCIGDYVAIEEDASPSVRGESRYRLVPKRIEGEASAGLDISNTLSVGPLFFREQGRMALDVRVVCNISFIHDSYFDLSLSPGLSMTFEAGLEGEISKDLVELIRPKLKLPIPDTPFLLVLGCGPVVEPKLEGSVKASTETRLGYRMGIKYEHGDWDAYGYNTSKWFSTPDVTGNIRGSLFLGVGMQIGVESYGEIVTAKIEGRLGGEISADLSTDLFETTAYEKLAAAEVSLDAVGSVKGEGEIKLTKWMKYKREVKIFEASLNVNKWKLVPTFSMPEEVSIGSKMATLSVVPENKLIRSVSIGMRITDEDGKVLDTQWCDKEYRVPEEWPLKEYKATFNNLTPITQYHVSPVVKFLGIEIPATPVKDILTTAVPVTIRDVRVKSASYYPQHYAYNGQKYDFRFIPTVQVELDKDAEGVVDWGYVYVDPEGNAARVPVPGGADVYNDERYAYCRNEYRSSILLAPYVLYEGDDVLTVGHVREFPIEYPREAGINLTGCEFQGTSNNVSFEGHEYKYKSTFRYLYTATGAYWLKVGTAEQGSGWSGWNLPNLEMAPVDGANALTVNYYYDDQSFSGDFNVRLKAADNTHYKNYSSSAYVTYSHSSTQFTGCTFHPASSASRSAAVVAPWAAEEAPVYNIVINKPNH